MLGKIFGNIVNRFKRKQDEEEKKIIEQIADVEEEIVELEHELEEQDKQIEKLKEENKQLDGLLQEVEKVQEATIKPLEVDAEKLNKASNEGAENYVIRSGTLKGVVVQLKEKDIVPGEITGSEIHSTCSCKGKAIREDIEIEAEMPEDESVKERVLSEQNTNAIGGVDLAPSGRDRSVMPTKIELSTLPRTKEPIGEKEERKAKNRIKKFRIRQYAKAKDLKYDKSKGVGRVHSKEWKVPTRVFNKDQAITLMKNYERVEPF